MKVALVHDYIKEYGGAERVLEVLHEIWPDAPVFTSVYLPKFLGPHKKRFAGWNIQASFLQYVPFKQKLISFLRLIAPLVFKTFDLSSFDLIIVSATGAYTPNAINKKSALQVCYCHTPPRYLYGYATAREWKKSSILGSIGEIINHFLRLIDFKSSQNVNYFIANSINIKGRIMKFYRRSATVIYPPVDINSKRNPSAPLPSAPVRLASPQALRASRTSIQNDGYYLAGGRIARPKHIDLIIETFEKLDLPLVVFGREFAGSRCGGTVQNSKITLVGEISDEEKIELMRKAKAFVFAAEDEDFGITLVEAMSVGTPVIAYKSGGVMESVADEKTGVFFNELAVESLIAAIEKFEKMKFDQKLIINQAQKFSKERFKKEIKEFVSKVFLE